MSFRLPRNRVTEVELLRMQRDQEGQREGTVCVCMCVHVCACLWCGLRVWYVCACVCGVCGMCMRV